MKKRISLSILSILWIAILSSFQNISNECDTKTLKAELKKEFKANYKYDSSKTNRFTYSSQSQSKEIEVLLFIGEKYQFLFNTAGLPEDVKIEFYNKKVGGKKRKLLHTLSQKEGQHIYSYEPENARKVYINYTIPETSEVDLKGCLELVVGYQSKEN